MSFSGKQMDKFTKGIQNSLHQNSTIRYRETGCGIEATITSAGNEFISQSYSSKSQARQEAVEMAEKSLQIHLNK